MQAFKFDTNRVWRVYQGGAMIDRLRGENIEEDGSFPEDWVASMVEANNPQNDIRGEGVSKAIINGDSVDFNTLVKENPVELLGEKHVAKFGPDLGFLTKILDSAIRLPIQAHPDREASLRIYNSKYGKTETWIVLGTREINGEKPYLMLGFNENLDKDVFISEALTGDMPKSLDMVHKHEVNAGDVILLEGGLVHAIGPGVFLIEIMEPTDLVTQPELYCGTQKLTNSDRFGEAEPKMGMEVFHYESLSKEDAWRRASVEAKTLIENDDFELLSLLERETIRYFGAQRLNLKRRWSFVNNEKICRAGIVCDGDAILKSGDNELQLKQGDTFFIPASLDNAEFIGKAQIIFALPPV